MAALTFLVGSLARADGPYALLEVGGLLISQQDATDAMNVPGYASPGYSSSVFADPSLTIGYRSPGMLGFELTAETYNGREYAYNYSSGGVPVGNVSLYAGGGNTWWVGVGPVLSDERDGFLFLKRAINELGAKVGYFSSTITETTQNLSSGQTGSATAAGSSYMGSVFYRLRGPFNGIGLNAGFEIGYQFAKVSNFVFTSASGTLASLNGQQAKYYNGNAYLDNSGPYLKLVFGIGDLWSSEPTDSIAATPTPVKNPLGKFETELRRLEQKNVSESVAVEYQVCGAGKKARRLKARLLKAGWERDGTCNQCHERTFFHSIVWPCWVLKPGQFKGTVEPVQDGTDTVPSE